MQEESQPYEYSKSQLEDIARGVSDTSSDDSQFSLYQELIDSLTDKVVELEDWKASAVWSIEELQRALLDLRTEFRSYATGVNKILESRLG